LGTSKREDNRARARAIILKNSDFHIKYGRLLGVFLLKLACEQNVQGKTSVPTRFLPFQLEVGDILGVNN
jgi:hypothetical protein